MHCLRRRLEQIFLYKDKSTENLDLAVLKDYLKEKMANIIDISIRKDFISYHLQKKDIDKFAKELAKIRVRNIGYSSVNQEPFYGEIQYEKNLLEDKNKILIVSVLYDGFKLSKLFFSLIPEKERILNYCHIAFTSRLPATFDEIDKRYHARVIICSIPSIISTTGIVEAPAKPKEFYLLRQKYTALGIDVPIEVIKKKFYGEFIDYNDKVITDVMKGYALQALFYHLTFQPFCSNRNCRLFNAHWQRDLIRAQLISKRLCKKHEKILSSFK